MEFENDIFVSYAHIDDQPLIEGTKGWVTSLHRALAIRLSQLLGREPRIWRDPKLQGNDVFADKLVERLPRVALLVSVISPRYVRSDWCLRELSEFVKATAATGGPRLGDKVRVFKVVKTPVPHGEHPEQLRDILGYEFFALDPDSGRAREFSQTADTEAQKQYWAKLDDLAHDIAEFLQSMESQRAPSPRVDDITRAVMPTPVESGPQPEPQPQPQREQQTVYLADTSFDLRDKRDAIKRELHGRGHIVVPDRPLPLVDSECRQFVREQLAGCRLSVHLIGETYGLVPEGGTESLVVLQNELAIERSLADTDFIRLIWKQPELSSEDDRQQRFIEHLETDARIQVGADVLETTLEDFKTTINNRLAQPKKSAVKEEAVGESSAELVRIYLICDQRDGAATAELEDCLFDKGYEVTLPVFEGDEAQVRRDHEENLSICDAVLLYYGAGNELWMRRKLREVQRSAAYGRAKPMVAKAIYTAPPSSPEKEHLRTREAIVLHQEGSFSQVVLEPFLAQLKGVGA